VAARHRLGAFYRLAAYTGARTGELLHLRWSDVDLDAAEVTVTGSTDVIDGERHEGTTKGGRSRVVSLDAGTVEIMREHRRAQVAEQLAAGEWWQGDGDLVFRADTGAALYPSTVSSLMRKLIATTALPHARLHDLRHVHATTLLLAGVPVHIVAARLGHADPSITLKVYAHVLREQTAGVADVFAQAIEAS
jgi:integrase